MNYKDIVANNKSVRRERISFPFHGLWIMLLIVNSFFTCSTNAQNILAGPYLIGPVKTGETIRWEFDRAGNYVMAYGIDTLKTQKVHLKMRGSRRGGFLYEAVLTRLKENVDYYYRLLSIGGNKWHRFHTYKNGEKNFSFVAMGDSRSYPDIFSKIMRETEKAHPDFIISMGDLVEEGDNYKEWHDYYFSVVNGIADFTPIVSTLGDHEAVGDNGVLFRYYLRKKEPVDKLWFSFDYGDAHFISLDYRHPNDREMIEWFKKDIVSAHKKWNFVYMHRPMYNLGGHRSDWGRDKWPALCFNYHVDIVFAGHSHLYERFFPAKPENKPDYTAITYITTGGAGAELYESVKNPLVLACGESVNHFIEIKIDGDTLNMKTIGINGNVFDNFRIIKQNGQRKFQERVISIERLNTITNFNSAIAKDMTSIPLYSVPARYHLELESFDSTDIPFSVQVLKKSKTTYFMKPYADTLHYSEKKSVLLNIFRKKEINISSWGELSPELRLLFIYYYQGREDTIIGKSIDYWPDENN